ncbi:MAG: tetraacyldisaccharide 4'-kinase [Parvularculaceae bacterium]
MKEPWFWRDDTRAADLVGAALAPLAALYDAGQRLRAAQTKAARADVPVLCVGNAALGGVGKTPFALLLADLLSPAVDGEVFFLTRGHGGAEPGPSLLRAGHGRDAAAVGDEALLLAARRPPVVARDRPAGAALAAREGARAIVMDDGYQNPTLEKDVNVLLWAASDAADARTFPAGPLREPARRAAARADAVVVVGPPDAGHEAFEPPLALAAAGEPTFRARLEPVGDVDPAPVVAFCGLGRPQRFFDLLRSQGFDVRGAIAFPDHHPYTDAELGRLAALAERREAALITTEKDHARLTAAIAARTRVLRVEMRVDDPDGLMRAVTARLNARRPGWRG